MGTPFATVGIIFLMIGMPIELVALYYTILEFVRSIDMTSQNHFIFWSSALGAISSIGILVMRYYSDVSEKRCKGHTLIAPPNKTTDFSVVFAL